MKTYDLIILGAGPAGITAAVYAARKKLDFLVITQDVGGQTVWSGDIENYTGYQFISGPDLALKFQEHMNAFSMSVHMPEEVQYLAKAGRLVEVRTDKGSYLSKAAIIATGKHPRSLSVPGEKEFRNRGVTYCATCDGPLFKDKTVAVVGGGNSALDAALQMIKISPKVHVINTAARLTADPVMTEKLQRATNAEIWNNAKVTKISGDTFVGSCEVEKDGVSFSLAVSGILIEIGLIPNSDFTKAVKRNDVGEIIVDNHNSTDIEGIFSAGDVTDVFEKQIIVACGEGAKACLAAFHYLSTHDF
ncbi:MAG: FAD-dependent oxidoreductase [Candidatus Omnitrophota bacterium]